MKLLIAGGTGFVGKGIVNKLKKNHQITVVTRSSKKSIQLYPDIESIEWSSNILTTLIQEADVVINLVGENIGNKRWTSTIKNKIISSRVKSTKKLCEIIESIEPSSRPRLLNASAIGIYGLQKSINEQNCNVYTEDSLLPSPPLDFLSTVGQAWEGPLDSSKIENVVKLRFGVILHPSGGMINKLYLPFKFGLGGKVGSGKQPISWISLEDVIGIISYLIDNPNLNGVFNLVTKNILSQHEFAQTFAKILNRPCVFPMPSIVVKFLFGQMGKELLLNGQSVSSNRLYSYNFKYPSLEKALSDWYL